MSLFQKTSDYQRANEHVPCEEGCGQGRQATGRVSSSGESSAKGAGVSMKLQHLYPGFHILFVSSLSKYIFIQQHSSFHPRSGNKDCEND